MLSNETKPTGMSPKQWDQFYRAHCPWLIKIVCRYSGCRFVAEDISHDTFLKVLVQVSPSVLRGLAQNPKGFLRSMAKHLLIDKIRRDLVEQSYWDSLQAFHLNVSDYQLDEHVAAIEALSKLSQALEALPHLEQSAFLLYYIDDLKHQDIAERLAVSVSTVRRAIARCMMNCYHLYYESEPS